MPLKLKKLLAYPRGATGKGRTFEPDQMKSHQRFLLFGGGLAVSAFILFCAALLLWLEINDYNARARSTFLIHEAPLLVKLGNRTTTLERQATYAETNWSTTARPSENLARQFSAQNGRALLLDKDGHKLLLALGVVTPEHPAATFAPFLALTEIMRHAATAISPSGKEPVAGYFYDLSGNFLAILRPSDKLTAQALAGTADTAALIRNVMPDIGKLHDPLVAAQWLANRQPIWLPPNFDPLTGRPMLRLVQPTFDANGKPFGVLVGSLPITRLFEGVRKESYDGAFAILDSSGNVLLIPEHEDAGLVAQIQAARLRNDGSTGLAQRHQDGLFSIRDDLDLPGTNWSLVYAYSWRTILTALAPRLATIAGLTMLSLALLWGAIVVFNRKFLVPGYRRALRLSESEVLNRAIIRTAPAGIGLLGEADGDVILRNDVMLSYEKLTEGPPLSRLLWQAYRDAALSPGQGRKALIEHELTVQLRDIGATHLQVNVVQARYQEIDVLLCTLLDVTVRKQTEEKLEDARAAAELANKAKSTFLATMSHEIRTPLNAIMGNLELLGRSPLSDIQHRRLQIVESSSDSLLHIINDVLDLSKVEAHQMSVEAIPFDLAALLRETAAIFTPLAQAKGLALTCTIGDDIARCYRGDPTRIRQIVSNLLSNAVKFTENGRITIDARTTFTDGQAPAVAIHVSDTGIGIPSASLPTLFDVYIQADTTIHRRFGGTGLGLPLCRRLAELMDGTIAVHSTPGSGSRFTLTLPLSEERVARAADLAAPVIDTAQPDDTLVPVRVLVAEDHPASRALLRDQLDELGYDADIVEDGRRALRAFNEESYDIVLTDLGMPELDGYTLAMCLREQHAGVPVIAMTAHATSEDKERCAQLQIADVVLKPLSLRALDAVLRHHTRRAALRGSATPAHDRAPPLSPEVKAALQAATRQSMTSISAALATGDVDTVTRELHSMKGGFALAGNSGMMDRCASMECLARDEELAAVQASWTGLETEILDALKALDEAAAGPV